MLYPPIFIDDHTITCPISYCRQTANQLLVQIKNDSQEELKWRLEEFERHFRKEMRYDIPGRFRAYDDISVNDRYYLFSQFAEDLKEYDTPINPNRLFGGCGFGKSGDRWCFKWVWLHPYFRHQGLFKKCWEELEAQLGEFDIEHPVSNDMRAFLQKHKPALLKTEGL